MDDDIHLIDKAINGDKSALEQIIAFYYKKIYSFIYNIVRNENDAVDIAQETFLKAFKNIQSFDTNKSFCTWLYTIAKNTAINYINKNNKHGTFENIDDLYGAEIQDNSSNPSNVYENKNLHLKLINLIDMLPEKYSVLIHMKYLFGFSYEEISKKLAIPIYKVESRLYMARKKLLQEIAKDPDNEFNS